jgi:hypothetical protein
MAIYKNGNNLQQSQDGSFDTVHEPGAAVPHSGIYRCTGCGKEIVAESARQFPSQNHHQHMPLRGAIRWQMIVYADHEPK